jgi:hypothetical protein
MKMEEKPHEGWLAVVKEYGRTLKFVPEKHKTAELCLMAVQANDLALEFLPEELKEEVRKAAGISIPMTDQSVIHKAVSIIF